MAVQTPAIVYIPGHKKVGVGGLLLKGHFWKFATLLVLTAHCCMFTASFRGVWEYNKVTFAKGERDCGY